MDGDAMNVTVRCKVKDVSYRTIYMEPMTPIDGLPANGRICLTIEGPGFANQVKAGDYYDLTFTQVPAAPATTSPPAPGV